MTRKLIKQSMIDDANEAAEILANSALAAELKRHRFTAATMRQYAKRLTMLRTRAQIAKGKWISANAALEAEAQAFAKWWSKYCNLVRGLTADVALRNEHGVSTPGLRKTSSLHRGPRLVKTSANTNAKNDASSTPIAPETDTGTDGSS